MFGRKSDKDLKILQPTVSEINQLYEPLKKYTDEELKHSFNSIKQDYQNLIENKKLEFVIQKMDESLIDDKLYELEKIFLEKKLTSVFAIVKDVARRLSKTPCLRPYGGAFVWVK